jgi:hypothetical protein
VRRGNHFVSELFNTNILSDSLHPAPFTTASLLGPIFRPITCLR